MHKNLQLFYVLIFVTAMAAGIRWYLGRKNEMDVTQDVSADFAIADTASVSRIVIADKDGYMADIRRQSGQRYWALNNRFLARKDAVDLLLKTFKRIAIKSPVSDAEKPTVMRMLAGRAKKVEIFIDGQGSPLKTWYIGTATPSHTGTYMLLETKEGMAAEPFITHMEGFTGFLSTRFFTDEREWRYTGVFDHPDRTLTKVELTSHEALNQSWRLEASETGHLELYNVDGVQETYLDTSAVQDLFLRYRKVHLETYNNHLSPQAEDSLLNDARPAYTLRTWSKEVNKPDSIQLFWKAPIMETYDDEGNPNEYDGSRMYGRVHGNEIVLVQRFVFDPLLIPLASIQK